MATSEGLRRPAPLGEPERYRVFIPAYVWVDASTDDLIRWQGQLDELIAEGWKAEERLDAERNGRWLTLTPPDDPEAEP